MKSVEIFTWAFSPPDSFEQEFSLEIDGQVLHVGVGSARVEIESNAFEADPAVVNRIHDVLKDYLVAAELVTGSSTRLSRPERETLREDGKRVVYAEMMSLGRVTSFGRPDLVERDFAGNLVRDTRQERVDCIKSLGERIAAQVQEDGTFRKLIASYRAAMRDPSDELVHLYEIADALKSRFGRPREVQGRVAIHPEEWGRFEMLCNRSELRQSRHRGLAGSVLRDATCDELHQVRSLARKMIEGYLCYLERARNE
ncbi:putative ferric uptake regulation protein [Thauera humireducens]|jgi:hypothetical protein|uniref:hypothetical protein n=1 Tax=Thauera humireducens TaxID=1134435 RepID=UPI002467A4F3|nr:hypothetical protein [Thauera humireducens]CAH1745214.1 putative ferric uptake regulation protein [Thauera humireducens]